MPIKVTCKCGQSFAAKEQLAGKAVKCPKCAQPLRIPQPQQKPPAPQQPAPPAAGGLGDLLDEAGMSGHEHDDYQGARCPSCDAPLAHNATLCVECGLNLQTGKFMKGIGQDTKRGPVKAEGYEGAAQELLSKAEKALAAAPAAADRGEKENWFIPYVTAGALIAVGAVGFVLWMGFSRLINMPEEEAADQASRLGDKIVFIVALSLLGIGSLVWSVAQLMTIVHAFKYGDTVHGFLSIFISGYCVVYAFMEGLAGKIKLFGISLFMMMAGGFVFLYEVALSQMDFSASSLVQVIMGIAILVAAAAGMLLLFTAWITSMVVGFMDRVYHGILAIIFPIYGASYCIIRKDENEIPAKLWLYGIFITIGDIVITVLMGAVNAAKAGDVGVGTLIVTLMILVLFLVIVPLIWTQIIGGLIASAIGLYNAMFAKKKKHRVEFGGYGEVSYMGFVTMLTSYVGAFTPMLLLGIGMVMLFTMVGGMAGYFLSFFSLVLVVHFTPMVFVLSDMVSYLTDVKYHRALIVSTIFIVLYIIWNTVATIVRALVWGVDTLPFFPG